MCAETICKLRLHLVITVGEPVEAAQGQPGQGGAAGQTGQLAAAAAATGWLESGREGANARVELACGFPGCQLE